MATDVQSEQLKNKFLAAFARTGNISHSARLVKIGRTTVYSWQEHDDDFSARFKQAERQAIDVLDKAAWDRAVNGKKQERRVYDRSGKLIDTEVKTDYSDTLLIFLLKSRDRAKYGDKVQSDSNVKIEGGYSDALAGRLAELGARLRAAGVAEGDDRE